MENALRAVLRPGGRLNLWCAFARARGGLGTMPCLGSIPTSPEGAIVDLRRTACKFRDGTEQVGEFHREYELGSRACPERLEGFQILQAHAFSIHLLGLSVDFFKGEGVTLRLEDSCLPPTPLKKSSPPVVSTVSTLT